METLLERYRQRLQHTNTDFLRSLMTRIEWNARLIGIKGARGVGKTTLLLQYIKKNLGEDLDKALYVSLDNIWFNQHSLVELADSFVKRGGKFLFVDEVHKYPNWSQEIKNIYDDYQELKIVFTGSSLLEILNARADLSRRAIIYHMHGLSFREYLEMELGVHFEPVMFDDIMTNHRDISTIIQKEIKPLQYFHDYLKKGYYPFYQDLPHLYYNRLNEVINMMLEIELPSLRKMELAYVPRIKQLLSIIAASVPFSPNVSKLSSKINISRVTLLQYLYYLDEVGLTINLHSGSGGISKLQKPVKIYLENTNLAYSLATENANMGNIRETFFANQLKQSHRITSSRKGDFKIDDQYVFEIGGKNKIDSQIKGIENAFIAADNIEIGGYQTIPLWLFGFMY